MKNVYDIMNATSKLVARVFNLSEEEASVFITPTEWYGRLSAMLEAEGYSEEWHSAKQLVDTLADTYKVIVKYQQLHAAGGIPETAEQSESIFSRDKMKAEVPRMIEARIRLHRQEKAIADEAKAA